MTATRVDQQQLAFRALALPHLDALLSRAGLDEHDRLRARAVAEVLDYPLHLGVTEAGGGREGLVKSSVGLGAMLLDGLGDTLRVSLTGDPLPEVPAAYSILRAAGVRKRGVEIISCPTCGRTAIDVEGLAFVIHRQLPEKRQYYTHRAGRTGRAGKTGVSICLIEPEERREITELEQELGLRFEALDWE